MTLSSIASSSSTSITPQFKYEVFLSFRGKDTRYNFTDHLCEALRGKQIQTFIDYELGRGDEISPSLLKAIEESQISVIIFSKNYASSEWCLEELVKILECKNGYIRQIVIPVFYNIYPSDVRHQTGPFENAFREHKEKESLDKVQRWKDALKEAANLSGWHSSIIKHESILIKDIVKDILKRLNDMSPSDNKDLVGIDSRIEEIKSLLARETVHSIGIWGIGGIGKTTLAEAVFNKISCQFEDSFFVQDIREQSEQNGGLIHLRKELLSAVLEDDNKNIGSSIVRCTFNRNRLGCKKLLIAFDDVTDFEQIKYLIGGFDCLNSSSRIIITTRDKRVLHNYEVDHICEVEELPYCDALELFCRYAFKQKHPTIDFMELSRRVAKYAGGVPLALKVLGSFLLDRRKEEWTSAMGKLERTPIRDIQKVLQISYDGLDHEEQEIFLDIACFFKGNDKDFVINALHAIEFCPKIAISNLIEKSLISISYDNTITMHDLIQAMAREIVKQESIKDPGQRSRLWDHKDICHVLTENTGTKSVEGISLDMSKIEDIFLNQHAFKNMYQLRFLKFYNSNYKENANKVHGFQALESDFAKLRYLSWYKYPFKSLPPRFHLESLVALEMHNSKVQQLWNGVKALDRLKEVDLSFSEHLTSCADISSYPNLERLILKGCTYLCEIPSSIQYLNKLNFLNLTYCTRLRSLPDCSGLTSLRKLVLSYSSNLEMLSEMPCNIEELCLAGTAIKELPSSVKNLSRLVVLDLRNCSRLISLPSSICKWKSLECLYLSDCLKLAKLPDDIGTLKSLRHFQVEGTGIREVPSSIAHLNNLSELSFRSCKGLLLPPLLGLNNLGELDLTDCGITKLPKSVGCLSLLRILNLSKNILESIPTSIINLSNLQSLDISFCKWPRHHDIGRRYVRFTNCFKLDQNILEGIVKDALPYLLPKIQWLRLATSLREEYCGKDFEDASTANICYPGKEIPRWFSYQSSGSIIDVKLPRNWFRDNFMGFAVSTLVEFPIHDSSIEYNLNIACQYTTSKDGQRRVVSEVFLYTPYIECPNSKLKHVIMLFDSRLVPHHNRESLSCSDEVSFQFCLRDDSSKRHEEFNMVEQCGVRLMYSQQHTKNSDGSFRVPSKEELDGINEDNGMYVQDIGEPSGSFSTNVEIWRKCMEELTRGSDLMINPHTGQCKDEKEDEPTNGELVVHGSHEGQEQEELVLPGSRFVPQDHELVLHYLAKKILDLKLPANIIKTVDLYQFDPHQLISELNKEPNQAYFFCDLEMIQSDGLARRTTKSGYWKITGRETKIFYKNAVVGFKQFLIFHWRKSPAWKRSPWRMHELRLNPSLFPANALNHTIKRKVERYVLCKIHSDESHVPSIFCNTNTNISYVSKTFNFLNN